MPLVSGQRLGPFEILSLIGEGGMGEVYRARDTRLDRTVALKLVKGQFSDRFEREARAISSLNHPNICTLHDIGADGGLSYLVMEYVEGEPLQGPLPVPQALDLAVKIASALAAAHANSIIHRDLKPGNILLTAAGPKLLDFGLAKFAPSPASNLELTVTSPVTAQGQIVGTLYYMAPEQLEGREADARSDIFAFGAVLYELLTGRRPFDGASPASLIAAILKEEPKPLAELLPLSPPALDRTVRKCLEKDPAKRWQTAIDLRDELAWIAEISPAAPQPMARRTFVPWLAASAMAGASATGLGVWSWLGRAPASAPRTTRFRWQPPQGVWLDRGVTRQTLAISPSGAEIAFIGRDQNQTMVYLRRLGSPNAEPLAGSEGAQNVFWAPDSQTIGFYAAGKLKRIPASGGTAVPICEVPVHWSATWNSHGQILAAASRVQSMLVDVASGSVTTWKSVFWPSFLPDGKRLLYLEVDKQLGGYRAYVEEISTGRRVALIPIETRVSFCPNRPGAPEGHLFYAKSGTLVAHPFDSDRLAFTGEPISVAEGIPYFRPAAWAEFSVSHERSIAFTTGYRTAQLAFVDRSGRRLNSISQPQPFWGDFRISRDGKRVAAGKFDIEAGGVDIWTYDLDSGAAERSTFQPGVEAVAIWSPDGRRIAYGDAQSSAPQLRVKSATGPGGEVRFPAGDFQLPSDWSADGKWIFLQTSGGELDAETLLASPNTGKLYPLLSKPFNHSQAVLSADGNWLAFVANESGRQEVYVQRFEDGDPPRLAGERIRASLDGGTFPRWNSNGRELFFLTLNREVVAAPFVAGVQPSFGPPRTLFPIPISFRAMTNSVDGFDVHPDGNRFLVLFGDGASESLDVISQWRPA